ncbi:MAG: hypothetical protein LBJ31_02125 [Treponema sp.]|jgi:hypothetical protein|nr:hypothetical protein [Treponema sp.]
MDNYKAMETVLAREVELLDRIPPLQSLIRDAVINRDWADYEILMESIGEIGERFGSLETERQALLDTISGNTEQEQFYTLTARLPERERNALGTLYRRLKMETLQIKLANDALMEYLKEARKAVAGVIETAYPERRGKLYTKDGSTIEADMKSVMINRHF